MSEIKPVVIFTGGHHTGALAVAQVLQAQGWQIIWIGHRHSMWGDTSDSAEFTDVTAAGIEFIELKAGKFYHTFHPLKLLQLPLGFIRSYIILIRLKRRFGRRLKGIMSFGGYLAVPVAICGWLLAIPCITHEQTTTRGYANRILAIFSRKIAVSWPETQRLFPSDKTVVTGLPIRPQLQDAKNHRHHQLPPLVYITAGKQGAHALNLVIFSNLKDLLERYRLVHQTGSSSLFHDYETALRLRSELPDFLKTRYQIRPYLDSSQLAEVLSGTDLVVGRSGAHTVLELAYLQIPSVLIPLPDSSHSEQQHNAQLLASYSLAVILPQTELSGQTLLASLETAQTLRPKPVPIITSGLENLVQLIKQTFS